MMRLTASAASVALVVAAVVATVLLAHVTKRAREKFTDENNPYVSPRIHRRIPDYWRQFKKDHMLNGAALDVLPGTRFDKLPPDRRVRVRRKGGGGEEDARLELVSKKGGVHVVDANDREVHRFEPGAAQHDGNVAVRQDLQLGDCTLRNESDRHRWDAKRLRVENPDTKYAFTLDASGRTPRVCMGDTCIDGDQLQKIWKMTHDASYTWDSIDVQDNLSATVSKSTNTTSDNAASTAEVHLGGNAKLAVDGRGDLNLVPSSACAGSTVRVKNNINTNFDFKGGGVCIGTNCARNAVPSQINGLYNSSWFDTVPYYECNGATWWGRSCSWETLRAPVFRHLSNRRHAHSSNLNSYKIIPT